MKLFESYNKAFLGEFWTKLEEDLIVEAESLESLIKEANEVIFKKFGINPNERKYFIAGSSRLYLYPELREAFNLESTIGDLDIVIPNKEDWINAGLEDEWNENGLYRPTEEIEAFNVWDPSKAGGAYADVTARPTNEILADATNINGYYFMPMQDIIDYKLALNREKEADIVKLIMKYQQAGGGNRRELFRRMAKIIGLDKTKEFIGKIAR